MPKLHVYRRAEAVSLRELWSSRAAIGWLYWLHVKKLQQTYQMQMNAE